MIIEGRTIKTAEEMLERRSHRTSRLQRDLTCPPSVSVIVRVRLRWKFSAWCDDLANPDIVSAPLGPAGYPTW